MIQYQGLETAVERLERALAAAQARKSERDKATQQIETLTNSGVETPEAKIKLADVRATLDLSPGVLKRSLQAVSEAVQALQAELDALHGQASKEKWVEHSACEQRSRLFLEQERCSPAYVPDILHKILEHSGFVLAAERHRRRIDIARQTAGGAEQWLSAGKDILRNRPLRLGASERPEAAKQIEAGLVASSA